MKNLKQLLQQVFMFAKIIALLFDARWQSLIDSVPAMRTASDQFKAMLDAINEKIGRYHAITRGIAAQKRTIRQQLNAISYSIVASARSWAIRNANFELAAKIEVSFAEINSMTYKKFMPFIQEAISLIQPHVAALANYNVTPEGFAAWQQKFAEMQNILTGPQSAIQQRKTLGTDITNEVKTAMTFLDGQLTPLVANFQSTPEFFIGFYNNKKIGKPLSHHTRLIAHCETEVGAPAFGVTVTVNAFTDPQTGKTYPADSAVTDPNGDAEVIEFFAGNRTVTISGPNIQTTTFPAMQFERGRAITHTFIVRPSFTNIPAPQPNMQNTNTPQ